MAILSDIEVDGLTEQFDTTIEGSATHSGAINGAATGGTPETFRSTYVSDNIRGAIVSYN